jgi:hypothetical protein
MSRQRFTWVWVIGVLLTPILAAGDSPAATKRFEHVHALLVHPQDETLLVGTHRGLFRSLDAGVTWKRVEPEGDVPGHDRLILRLVPGGSGTHQEDDFRVDQRPVESPDSLRQ